MDEPTNHLDPQAREVLEDALKDFTGTLLFISHDRTFINNIATRVVEVIDGHLHSYIGNYDDYLRQKEKIAALGSAAPRLVAKPVAPKPEPVAETLAAKVNREDDRERRRREADLRAERKKLTRDVEKKISDIEAKISASETKLTQIHAEFSRQNQPAERYAELGRESRAVSEYLKTLYSQWEEASVELDSLESRFRESHGI
jgi:ATP-binding cassette subfamily F protein 3